MLNIEYDFSKFVKDKNKEEVRPNYRISRCCGNCSFYWYKGAKSRRGYCKYPDAHAKTIFKAGKEAYDEAAIRRDWTPTHTTCSCDLHKFKSKISSLKEVADYCKKGYLADGTLLHQEEDE